MDIGDYARIINTLEENVEIIKIKNIFTIPLVNEKHILDYRGYEYSCEEIIKSSPNIIDLIEVGDYVNRMLVTNIWVDKETGNIEFEFNNHESYLYPKSWNYESRVTKYKIKSIVTKEQFSSMEYKVGE